MIRSFILLHRPRPRLYRRRSLHLNIHFSALHFSRSPRCAFFFFRAFAPLQSQQFSKMSSKRLLSFSANFAKLEFLIKFASFRTYFDEHLLEFHEIISRNFVTTSLSSHNFLTVSFTPRQDSLIRKQCILRHYFILLLRLDSLN